MKKKTLSVLLALAMTAALAGGCGAQEKAPETSQKEETKTEEKNDKKEEKQKETEETARATETQEPEAVSGMEPGIHYTISYESDWATDPDQKGTDYEYTSIAYGAWETVSLKDNAEGKKGATEYPMLQKSLEEYNKRIEDMAEDEVKELLSEAKDLFGMVIAGEVDMEVWEISDRYHTSRELTVTRADKKAFSICSSLDYYSNGAHPFYGYAGVNFDPETGREIKLTDVIENEEEFCGVLEDVFRELYPDVVDGLLVEDLKEALLEELREDQLQWVFDPYGITVILSPYEVAAYAAGVQCLSVPYVKYPDLMKAEYFNLNEDLLPGNYGLRYSGGVFGTRFFDKNGDMAELEIVSDYGEYDQLNTLDITYNGRNVSYDLSDGWYYYYEPYVVCNDGNIYLYIDFVSDNDWRTMKVFALNDKGARFLEDSMDYMGNEVPSDPEEFRMTTRSDLLSTYSAYRTCHVGEDGMPVANSPYYYTDPEFPYMITPIAEVPALLLADETDEVGTEGVIPDKAKLKILRTDGMELVDLMDTNGRIYRVKVEFDEEGDAWQVIDGIDIFDLFDGMTFAG